MKSPPHHPHFSSAPGLTRDPGYYFQSILLFLGQILIHQKPIRIPAPADINANACVAMACKVFVHHAVPDCRAIRLAVWQIFQDRRDRVLPGVFRHPDARSQPGAIGQGYPRIFDDSYRMGKEVTVAYLGNVFNKDLPKQISTTWVS